MNVKHWMALCAGVVCSFLAHAQNFTFDPGGNYEATLPMETYTDHFVYVYHDSADSALISWRVVGNTCPEEWHISLCDWADCYSYLPNTGDMLPVAPEASGFIKLTMNPFMFPGEGYVHFWIYPTGHQEEHIDLFFHFNTEIVSVDEQSSLPAVYPNPFSTLINLNAPAGQNIRVTDTSGRIVFQELSSAGLPLSIGTEDWPAGIYFLTIGDITHILSKL